jgi:hypothetical protein
MPSTSRRQQILNEMATITRMERGKLCPMSRGPGSTTYFRLQCWQDGRNCTRYVPTEEVESVRRALANHDRFQALAKEFVDLTISMTHAEDAADAKKNFRKSKPNASEKRKPSSG